METPTHILLCRTDSIGDTVLTLPLAGFIKDHFANNVRITYLGRNYTRDVVGCCPDVDHFLTKEELMEHGEAKAVEILKGLGISHSVHVFPDKDISKLTKKAGIPHRIGTSHRMHHFFTINEKVNFTRKRSDLHESQLNFKLLEPLGINEVPSIDKITERFQFNAPEPDEKVLAMVSSDRPVILHPGSLGSAVEWGHHNFIHLCKELLERDIPVIFTGTEQEGEVFRRSIPRHPLVTDATGKLNLSELISLIDQSFGLVACSTGPLHLAGVLGKHTFGLFVPKRPLHPGRWEPLGQNVLTMMYDPQCTDCANGKECGCLKFLSFIEVANQVELVRNESK